MKRPLARPHPETTQILITEPGGMFVAGYKQRGFGAGLFLLPGGKLEPDEKSIPGAFRELSEEAGPRLADAIGRLSLAAVLQVSSKCPDCGHPFGTIAVYHAFASEAAPLQGSAGEFSPEWKPMNDKTFGSMMPDYRLWLPATYNLAFNGTPERRVYYGIDLRNIGSQPRLPASSIQPRTFTRAPANYMQAA